MRLSAFGLGQVGQVLRACYDERGHSVLGVDVVLASGLRP